MICAWILTSPPVCPSYDLPRETRKFKAHQLGEGGATATTPKSSLHPPSYCSLVLPLGFVPGFSSLNWLSFHFSLSRSPVSPICCLRSFVLSGKMSLFSGTGAQPCVPSLPGRTQHLPACLVNLCHTNLVPLGTINALADLVLGRRTTDVPCLGCSYCKTPCPAAVTVPLAHVQWFLRFQ